MNKKETIEKMISIYCSKHHGEEMCSDCEELLDYSRKKIDKCPNKDKFCSNCQIKCYDEEHRKKIKEVMKYSGPRMVFFAPGILVKYIKDKNIKFKNIISIVLGFIFMGLGGIGVILPILPTTPFLLLASYFFMKGSDKFNRWFRSTKLYINHLESFEENRSMTLRTKVCILGFASIMLALPFIKVDILAMRVFIIFLYIVKYYYFIFKIKTLDDDKVES